LQCSNDESTTPVVSPLGIEDARKLLKLVGLYARKKSGTGAFAALIAQARPSADLGRKKSNKTHQASLPQGFAGDQGSQVEAQVSTSAASGPTKPEFKVGDEVFTRAPKDKESFDGKHAKVVKVLSEHCRLLFLNGPCQAGKGLCFQHDLACCPRECRFTRRHQAPCRSRS
jgi:hypothetical protein